MSVPAPTVDPLQDRGRRATERWLQFFNTIEDTLEIGEEPISGEDGMVTPRWTAYFLSLATSTSAPAPVETRIEEGGFMTEPWIAYLLDLTG